MDLKLQLTKDKTILFEQHGNFKDSVSAKLKLDNGYSASIITRKSLEDNSGMLHSAQGSWDDETFELAVLDEKESFIQIEELNQDVEYSMNCGVWTSLSKNDLLEKIQIISNLRR